MIWNKSISDFSKKDALLPITEIEKLCQIGDVLCKRQPTAIYRLFGISHLVLSMERKNSKAFWSDLESVRPLPVETFN
jgi:hypothetical protein